MAQKDKKETQILPEHAWKVHVVVEVVVVVAVVVVVEVVVEVIINVLLDKLAVAMLANISFTK